MSSCSCRITGLKRYFSKSSQPHASQSRLYKHFFFPELNIKTLDLIRRNEISKSLWMKSPLMSVLLHSKQKRYELSKKNLPVMSCSRNLMEYKWKTSPQFFLSHFCTSATVHWLTDLGLFLALLAPELSWDSLDTASEVGAAMLLAFEGDSDNFTVILAHQAILNWSHVNALGRKIFKFLPYLIKFSEFCSLHFCCL